MINDGSYITPHQNHNCNQYFKQQDIMRLIKSTWVHNHNYIIIKTCTKAVVVEGDRKEHLKLCTAYWVTINRRDFGTLGGVNNEFSSAWKQSLHSEMTVSADIWLEGHTCPEIRKADVNIRSFQHLLWWGNFNWEWVTQGELSVTPVLWQLHSLVDRIKASGLKRKHWKSCS